MMTSLIKQKDPFAILDLLFRELNKVFVFFKNFKNRGIHNVKFDLCRKECLQAK